MSVLRSFVKDHGQLYVALCDKLGQLIGIPITTADMHEACMPWDLRTDRRSGLDFGMRPC
jgi:hypothetical protein